MASSPSPTDLRPCVGTLCRRRGSWFLAALVLVATCVPTAAARERPVPDPQELWRQFPLDEQRTEQTPTVQAPAPRERTSPVSSTASERTRDVGLLGLGAIALATTLVIGLATLVLAGLRGRVRPGPGREPYVPASRPSTPGRTVGDGSGLMTPTAKHREVETLRVNREAQNQAAKTAASSIDEVDTLKAKLATPAAPKDEATTNADQEILKSKREAAASAVEATGKRFHGVDALKRKLDREDVATRESLERQATEWLRTKLQEDDDTADPAARLSVGENLSVAEKPRTALELVHGSPAAAPRARPTRPPDAQRRTNRSGRSSRGSAAVAHVSAEVPELVEPSESPPQVKGRVFLWRGYVKAQFYAVEQYPKPARVIALSPLFRTRGWDRLPPNAGASADAHAALIESLERDGWSVVARGTRWFDVELERAEEPPLRGVPARRR